MAWLETDAWALLGIEETGDERAVKRAYAKRLKQTRPEDDPVAFQELRLAYERALDLARYVREHEEEPRAEQAAPPPPPTMTSEEITAAALSILQQAEIVRQATAQAPNAIPITTPVTTQLPELIPELAPELPQELPPRPLAALGKASDLHISPRQQVHDDNAQCLSREEIELDGTPFDIANQLWQEFVGQHDVLQSASLARLLASQALLNLEVRDAFEFYCAQYCADEHADLEMRATIVEFFQWQNSIAHLLKMHPAIPHVAMDRYFADRGFVQLQSQAKQGNQALQVLLAKQAPKFNWNMFDRGFIHDMRETLHQLQWRYPEVMRHKLDENIVEAWRESVNRKRYYLQTFFTSVVFGFALFLLLHFAFDAMQWLAEDSRTLFTLVLGEFIAIAGFAWFSFHPPERFNRVFERLRDKLLYKPVHVYRYQLRFQTAHLPFLVLTPLLLMGASLNDFTRGLFWLGSVLGCALAIYASSVYLGWLGYVLAFFLSFIGTYVFDFLSEGQISPIAGTILGYAFALFLLRTGPGVLSLFNMSQKTLQKERLWWLLVFGLMAISFRESSAADDALLPYLYWLILCVPGFLVMNMLVSQRIFINALLNLIVLRTGIQLLWPDLINTLEVNNRVKILLLVICLQAMYIVLNLVDSALEQRKTPKK